MLFRIEMRLEPGAEGLHELKGWPGQEFRPDFIVAASGLTRIELESKVVGVTAEGNQPTATATDHLNSKLVNYWLPDYTAGFARDLGRAALQIKSDQTRPASARFVDEPIELRLEPAGEQLKISFSYNGQSVTHGEVPLTLALAEIGRTLQDFVVQLLTLNPRLTAQEDVAELQNLISQIVANSNGSLTQRAG